jgi:MFS family permease
VTAPSDNYPLSPTQTEQTPLTGTAASPAQVDRPPGIFYGWWIVAGGFLLSTILGGLVFHSFGAYVVVLEEEFGWSRTALSVAFSIQMVESGLLGPLQGWALDHYGPRRIMLVGITIFACGFFFLSQIDSLMGFYGAFVIIALGMSLGSMMGVMVAIVNWFNRRRALAMALQTIGFACGGFLQPGIAWSLEEIGWRETAFASGLIVLVVVLPLATLMRHRPEDYGWAPDGAPPRESTSTAITENSSDEISFTVGEAIRTRAFWFISIGHGASLFVIGAVMVHLVAHLNETLGYSLAAAANVVLIVTALTVFGMLFGGIFGDRFEKRYLLAAAMVGHTAGLFVLTFAETLPWIILFAMLHGISFGVRAPLTAAIRADYFGRNSFGTLLGFSSMIILIGMVTGPIVAGISYDQTGSYQSGFLLISAVGAIGSLFFFASKQPPPPARLTLNTTDSSTF